MRTANVAIVGLGTVGGGVFKILRNKASSLSKKSGVFINLLYIYNRSKKKYKQHKVPKDLIATSIQQILNDKSVDCVVELIGGTTHAKDLVLSSLKAGKDVVTANKALLALHGVEIYKTAEKHGRQIFFEASVGGGIPIIKTIRESLVGNRISSATSIINGTANYILSKMSFDKMGFDDALRLAQEKGYAEADPTFDIEGVDAAHKVTILAQLLFHKNFKFKGVQCEGITDITQSDILFAEEMGYVVKLLAIARKLNRGYEVRVQPALLHKEHILANVHGSYNAVHLEGDEIGDMVLYGKGAGEGPTASAVVSDIVDIAKDRVAGSNRYPYPKFTSEKPILVDNIKSRYYLRVLVEDKPNVVAKISSILGKLSISISDVIQRERKVGGVVPLIFLTHETQENSIRRAIGQIKKLSVVKKKAHVLRIVE